MNTYFEKWISGYVRLRYPELEPALRAASDADDAIRSKKCPTADLLEPIITAASSQRRPLSETGTTLLGRLAVCYPEACAAVGRMAQSKSSHVRFNAVLCLRAGVPRDVAIEILKGALRDRSSQVRKKAADQALALRYAEMTENLEEAAAEESDARVKETLLFSTGLLRAGYLVEPRGSDSVLVTALTRDSVRSRLVPNSQIHAGGLAAVVSELQRK